MRATRSPIVLAFALAALLVAPGCLTPGGERQNQARIETLEQGSQLSDAQLRLEMMRFADGFATGLYGASERLKDATEDPRKRFVTQTILLHSYWDAVNIAAGQDPEINLLDMMVSTMLLRLVLEEYWIPEVLGDAGRTLLKRAHGAEREVWAVGALLLDEKSLDSVRAMAKEWHERHLGRDLISGVRFNDFTIELDEDDRKRAIAIANEVQGATIAAREVELAAERILFTLHHMPFLLRMQANLAYYELVRETEARELLDELGAISRTVTRWPEDLAAERTAAIEQAFAGVAAEREALLASLDQARPMLTELRQTLEAGTALVDGGSALADALGLGEPGGEPFDITPYDETVAEVTRASEQVTRTLTALRALLDSEGASSALPEVVAAADGLLLRVFWLLVALVAVSAVIVLAASLAYRALARRLPRTH